MHALNVHILDRSEELGQLRPRVIERCTRGIYEALHRKESEVCTYRVLSVKSSYITTQQMGQGPMCK